MRGAGVLLAGALLSGLPLTRVRSQDDGADAGRNKVHLPISDEAQGLLDGALRASKEGDADRAADLVRSVLDRDLDSRRSNQILVVDEPRAAPDAPKRYVGVTERAIQVSRELSPEAVASFRKKFDYKARAAQTAALEGEDPIRDLLRVYDHYPVATNAPEILQQVADRSFEKNELERARRLYVRLLRDHKAELKSAPAVRAKLILACILLGKRAEVERLWGEAAAEAKDFRLQVNGATISKDEARELALKNDALAHGDATESKNGAAETVGPACLAHPRGDAANRAAYGRAWKLGKARFRAREFQAQSDAFDPRSFRAQRGNGMGDAGPARHLPVVWNDTIFLATADRIRAFTLDGQERPARITPLSPGHYDDDNANIQSGAAIERGILIAPYVDRVQDEQQFRGIPIKVKIPQRKLGGFDVSNPEPEKWRWKWNHKEVLVGTRLEQASFPCAPVCEDGMAFTSCFAIEGFVHCYTAGFDPETGALRWATWVASGQVEQTMFGEHAREPLCAPVAVADGIVYDATQMGCIAAMDEDTGRIKWLAEYDQLEVRSAKGYYPDPRNIIWENNAPLVEDGVVVIGPMDSELYFFFDAATGKKLFQSRKSFDPAPENRYLLGGSQGRVVVSGTNKIACLDVHTGKRLWETGMRHVVSGRGLIAAGKVVVPAGDTIEVIDLVTGTVEGEQPALLTGNLALAGDAIVVASDNQVQAFVNERPEKNANRGRDF